MNNINVIGAGLAGCEAAWQIAQKGLNVNLYEMKPNKKTPAHSNDNFAELVCSNSLKSTDVENASGLLKEELRLLNSLIVKCADETRVPAGGALAVDREAFSWLVSDKITNHPKIHVINEEVDEINLSDINIIATGPLTSDVLIPEIFKLTGSDNLYFFDAAAPVISYDSIDMNIAFKASRYDKGSADYINCPMNRNQYENFIQELLNAEVTELKKFEDKKIYEGCMPVEIMAKRGFDTLRFGPLKPVGLVNPYTDKEEQAIVQLRQDNSSGTLYNMVGFQTRLKWGEQKRIFRMIPGLENAEFERYGVMHRNLYINSQGILDETYMMKNNKGIFFAGQITGVEGYMESTSSGLLAGLNAVALANNQESVILSKKTACGALVAYVSEEFSDNFQPMGVNFGIIEKADKKIRKKRERRQYISDRALAYIKSLK